MNDLHEYLSPVNSRLLNNDNAFRDQQLGNQIRLHESQFPDLTNIDIVIVGVNEYRGAGYLPKKNAADAVRSQLYKLYHWHPDIAIADIGNIDCGSSLGDSYAAIRIILKELFSINRTVIVIGGSHDLTLAIYTAFKETGRLVEATVVDARIDMMSESNLSTENFLLEMLTSEPNFVKHYNHIAFQSYFVHPRMLETIDKLRFDCFRVGVVKEQPEEMEPVIRNSDIFSFDMSALRHSDAPSGGISPNGLSGEEACSLFRYAGLSPVLSAAGIFGYEPATDEKNITAMQIAQMIWYFIDGKSRSKQEAELKDLANFNEYHTVFAEIDTVFLQSKKTGRWWMQLPDKKMIACSYNDYVFASNNEIPERWLRAQERESL